MALLRILITGAGGPLGVNVTRSLRCCSLEVSLIGTDANRWHLPLSLCDKTYLIPPARDVDAYAEGLKRIVEEEQIDCLIPTHPVEVRAVSRLVDDGRLGVRTALPRPFVLDITDDKAVTQRALLQAGLAVPATLTLHAREDVDRAFDTMRTHSPVVWIRGSGAPGLGIGGAALPCRDASVAKAWVDHHGGWGRMIASEYLAGDNATWMAAFWHGDLIAAAARQRLEYVLPHVSPSGITGAPAVSRTVRRPELSTLGEAAVRAVDERPHGVFFVDFKGDHDNRPRVTEINAGRCGTTVHFYTEAGFNFPELLVRMAMGFQRPVIADANEVVEPDLYWVRTLDCGPVLVRGDAGFDNYLRAGR